jgi:hypothetical protein
MEKYCIYHARGIFTALAAYAEKSQSEICAESILDKATNVWYTIITGENP